MRGDNYHGPARTVYETLAVQPPLAASEYTELIEQLTPLYLEEVICPVHLAVRNLRAAADAVAAGDVGEAIVAHHTGQARLYDALWHADLLTLDEELQEVTADLTEDGTRVDRATQVKATNRLRQRQWQAWRAEDPP